MKQTKTCACAELLPAVKGLTRVISNLDKLNFRLCQSKQNVSVVTAGICIASSFPIEAL